MKQSSKIAAAASAALIAFAACGAPAILEGQDEQAEVAIEQQAETENAEAGQAAETEGEAEVSSEGRTAGGPEEEPVTRIECDLFSFDLPEYWVGKVDWCYNEAGDGVLVYPLGLDASQYLISVQYVPGTEPEIGGDIGTGLIASISGQDPHIEIWRMRWEALAQLDPEMRDRDTFELLVDLSTFGEMSFEEAKTAELSMTYDEKISAVLISSLVEGTQTSIA